MSTVLLIAAVIVLIICFYWIWWKNESFDSSPNITLHHKPWCKYCKKIMPYWDQAKAKYGKYIKFKEHNEENAHTNGITGVPTIRLNHNGHSHNYNHEYIPGHLEGWLTETLRIPPM